MGGLKERAKTLVDLLDGARFLWADRPLPLDDKAAALLTPDARTLLGELAAATGIPSHHTEDLLAAGQALVAEHDFKFVTVTMSEKGISVLRPASSGNTGIYHSPARAREVFDVSGAGDTVIATLAACLAGGLQEHRDVLPRAAEPVADLLKGQPLRPQGQHLPASGFIGPCAPPVPCRVRPRDRLPRPG